MLKVVIFSASFGSGHKSASEAIHKHFKHFYQKEVNAEMVDFFETLTPKLNEVAKFCYEKSVEISPVIYGTFFDLTNAHSDNPLVKELGRIGLKKAKKFLAQRKPDVVISTYPVSGGVTAELKDDLDILATTVITDFGVHVQWVHPETDLYFVGADRVRQFLVGKGISSDRVQITGIPIASKFAQKLDKKAVRQKFKLRDEFTVLVLGGAYGQAEIKKLCRELETLSIQTVVICGNNKKLYKDLLKIQGKLKNTSIYGFTNNVDEFMAASDIYIGKAGGLTVSEALAKGLPLIIFNPIPGQEVLNVDFIIDEGAAYLSRNIEDIVAKVKFLTTNQNRWYQVKENAERLGRSDATAHLCRKVLSAVREKQNEG